MAMRRFLMNKLVREKTVTDFEKNGVIVTKQTLADNDMYLEGITQKIVEELEEVFSAHSTEELIEELADLEEILSEFKKLVKIEQADVDKVRAEKIAKKGPYARTYVEYIDVPESAKKVLEYVLGKEEKYPELDPSSNEFLNDSDEYEDEDDEDYED